MQAGRLKNTHTFCQINPLENALRFESGNQKKRNCWKKKSQWSKIQFSVSRSIQSNILFPQQYISNRLNGQKKYSHGKEIPQSHEARNQYMGAERK